MENNVDHVSPDRYEANPQTPILAWFIIQDVIEVLEAGRSKEVRLSSEWRNDVIDQCINAIKHHYGIT